MCGPFQRLLSDKTFVPKLLYIYYIVYMPIAPSWCSATEIGGRRQISPILLKPKYVSMLTLYASPPPQHHSTTTRPVAIYPPRCLRETCTKKLHPSAIHHYLTAPRHTKDTKILGNREEIRRFHLLSCNLFILVRVHLTEDTNGFAGSFPTILTILQ